MESDRAAFEEESLDYERRQATALENIQSALMLLLALAIVASLIGLVFLFN
jgi:hypothetical protein